MLLIPLPGCLSNARLQRSLITHRIPSHRPPRTKTLRLVALHARPVASLFLTEMNVLERSLPSTGTLTNLDGSFALLPRPLHAHISSSPVLPLQPLLLTPSLRNHIPSRPLPLRKPAPQAHPPNADGPNVPKRNVSSTFVRTPM